VERSSNRKKKQLNLTATVAPFDINISCISSQILKFETVVASTQGHRNSMEDEHCLIENANKLFKLPASIPPTSFFSVFDGHGGVEAAKFAKDYLAQNIFTHPNFGTQLNEAIFNGYLTTDKAFCTIAEEKEIYCGTTALAAFIQGNKLIVANLGDSRAVLCRDSKAIPLSQDHKPSLECEKIRITEAGGWITEQKELNLATLYRINPELLDESQIPRGLAEMVGFQTVCRICGELSVSRSIGDAEYKGEHKNELFKRNFTDDLVIAEPQIVIETIGAGDLFMIMACDGLWDVFSSQEAVDFVRKALQQHTDSRAVTKALVNEALRRGSMDNISVLIVFLNHV